MKRRQPPLPRRWAFLLAVGLIAGTAIGLPFWSRGSQVASPLSPAGSAQPRPKLGGILGARPGTELQARVDRFVAGLPADFGTIGIAVKNLRTGEAAAYNPDRVFEAASLYKLGVMLALFEAVEAGELDLDDPITLPEWAVNASEWSVYYAGDVVSGWEALEAMITLSDNPTALVFMQLLGVDRINGVLKRYGLTDTHIDWSGATTTPADVLKVFELIETGRAVTPEASRQMREVLLRQRDNRRIPAGLPAGLPVAHKTGSLPGIAHDAGIIYLPAGPVVLVVLTGDLADYGAGEEAIAEAARLVADYFGGQG